MKPRLTTLGVLTLLCVNQSVLAGAGCVVAKKMGDSLAIEWVAAEGETAEGAIRKAEQKLLSQGHRGKYFGLHPQATTSLPHAYGVIVKTEYQTQRGKQRTSYGCGFSAHSSRHAQALALYNLRNYSWGWKDEYGYQVQESFRY